MTRYAQDPDRSERGQIVILFALLLVALVAMVGLILDSGSAYAQRREEQNAADLAALTGANVYLLTASESAAVAAARDSAAENGYDHGTNATVDVDVTVGNGVTVKVDISSPHANNFGGIVGLPTWDVDVTATALSGFPDTAEGGGPLLFNIDAFDPVTGEPLAQFGDEDAPFAFEGKQGDAPGVPEGFTWTNYGTGNLDSNAARDMIEGTLVITKTLAFGEYIGQHNQGSHTTLFNSVAAHMVGQCIPVPVVASDGLFQGWATFCITGADGSSTKTVSGYFKSPFVNRRLSVGAPSCGVDGCPAFFGSWVLSLID